MKKTAMTYFFGTMLIAGCATTNTGEMGGMIGDAAKDGDILGVGIMTLAMPFAVMMDVFTLGNTLDADDLKAVNQTLTTVSNQMDATGAGGNYHTPGNATHCLKLVQGQGGNGKRKTSGNSCSFPIEIYRCSRTANGKPHPTKLECSGSDLTDKLPPNFAPGKWHLTVWSEEAKDKEFIVGACKWNAALIGGSRILDNWSEDPCRYSSSR